MRYKLHMLLWVGSASVPMQLCKIDALLTRLRSSCLSCSPKHVSVCRIVKQSEPCSTANTDLTAGGCCCRYGFVVYGDGTVTDVACKGLNGMRMGDRTLTVRRATEVHLQPDGLLVLSRLPAWFCQIEQASQPCLHVMSGSTCNVYVG